VVLGDSLAEGLGVSQGRSFPDFLQRRLDRDGYSYRVVNLGVSGDTTTGGLGRLEYALSLKPAILVIELGGNDGLRGVPISSTKANLDRMIGAARENGTEVLLAGMTLPANYGPDYIRKFEAIYRDLARKYKIQLVPSLMQPIVNEIASRPNLMQRDGIHPSAEGHELLADNVLRYLEPMLKKP
jgi:acyl-CoA thioesterase-1